MSNDKLLKDIRFLTSGFVKALKETPVSIMGVKTFESRQLVLNVSLNELYVHLYGNIILNFKNNFNDQNLEEFSISKEEYNRVFTDFKDLFDKVDRIFKKSKKKSTEVITPEEYYAFKISLKRFRKGSYKLLEEVGKFVKLKECEIEIEKFKRKAQTLGKDIDIPIVLVDSKGREVERKNISEFTRH